MTSNNYAVVMAGGVGSRFWPKSRKKLPKQFQDFMGSGKSLLQHTVNRLLPSIPLDQIFILTHVDYKSLVQDQLPSFKESQLILEPHMRNTAPCLLFASLKIQKMNPDAQILVAPSDHWISNPSVFTEDLNIAFDYSSEKEELITFGIHPKKPNTGYGYLKVSDPSKSISKVLEFTEKPSLSLAQQFLNSGNYLWNSGIFVWSAKTIVKAFQSKEAKMYDVFSNGVDMLNTALEQEFMNNNYIKAENISIDFAIMERSDNVSVVKANFNWNDLGTWSALYDQIDKDGDENAAVNVIPHFEKAKGNMVFSNSKKLVVIKGLKDYIVVDGEDVLMIYPRKNDQEIKLLLDDIKSKYGNQFD
ncbi:mannose-1-phosphate guanylyltransferase [Flavobacteriaceae bacterium]|nr:mannose-1-phosphate guanylyltransferase [Flavobacteriaceae bacterium]